MKLLMENWRQYVNEQQAPGGLSSWTDQKLMTVYTNCEVKGGKEKHPKPCKMVAAEMSKRDLLKTRGGDRI